VITLADETFDRNELSPIKFNGSVHQLQSILTHVGYNVVQVRPYGYWKQFRTEQGAIVCWYYTTGTVVVQGKADVALTLDHSLRHYFQDWTARYNAGISPRTSELPIARRKVGDREKQRVFVVHGHDTPSREQLERILHGLGLDPFVLASTGGHGLTIIEALEREIGPGPNRVRFGIVLLTPDDMAYAKSERRKRPRARARQNVVFEMGMLIAALGRQNVAILRKGEVEIPSDAHGILYLPFREHVRETLPRLLDRLAAAGVDVSVAQQMALA